MALTAVAQTVRTSPRRASILGLLRRIATSLRAAFTPVPHIAGPDRDLREDRGVEYWLWTLGSGYSH